jgi:hypothetical protein
MQCTIDSKIGDGGWHPAAIVLHHLESLVASLCAPAGRKLEADRRINFLGRAPFATNALWLSRSLRCKFYAEVAAHFSHQGKMALPTNLEDFSAMEERIRQDREEVSSEQRRGGSYIEVA